MIIRGPAQKIRKIEMRDLDVAERKDGKIKINRLAKYRFIHPLQQVASLDHSGSYPLKMSKHLFGV